MKIAVLGSINLDIVASGAPLPRAGETVSGARLDQHPGGKGANQAYAARRLGADTEMYGRVGRDPFAEPALDLLKRGGTNLAHVLIDDEHPTGVALIAVSPEGENQITVCSGANAAVAAPQRIEAGALICQLEVPIETVADAFDAFDGFAVANLAPAAAVPDRLMARADLLVVNETEMEFYGESLFWSPALIAVTLGARGAELWRQGERIAAATPPQVEVVDTTGAGDVFVAALTVALMEQQSPQDALRFACAAGALATTRPGAQPAAPTRAEVEAMLGGHS
ncbi:ribokinase [Brevundimonas aveniformis]|uniref:ribokinase n=1 Tax=Brevundimonas aveniformis TaxID=370977 RepID=UPI000419442B|nr:ribokinase [Brevundimonas aveniformis]